MTWSRQSQGRSASVCRLLFVGQDWERKGRTPGSPSRRDSARPRHRCGTHRGRLHAARRRIAARVGPMLGFISKTTEDGYRLLDQLFAESHFFLLPTTADCTPIVFAEANSFGLPVITTDVGGIPTMVHSGLNGLVFPTQAPADDYARAIADLFADRTRYMELVRTSFLEFQNRLNWRVAGARVMGYLRTLSRNGVGTASV